MVTFDVLTRTWVEWQRYVWWSCLCQFLLIQWQDQFVVFWSVALDQWLPVALSPLKILFGLCAPTLQTVFEWAVRCTCIVRLIMVKLLGLFKPATGANLWVSCFKNTSTICRLTYIKSQLTYRTFLTALIISWGTSVGTIWYCLHSAPSWLYQTDIRPHNRNWRYRSRASTSSSPSLRKYLSFSTIWLLLTTVWRYSATWQT